MKKILSALTICLLGVCLLFSGCASPLTMPVGNATNGANNGNIRYEDYLYFSNASVSVSDLKDGDNSGNLAEKAIYRTKLVNGKFEYDEDGYAENVEKVTDKLGAFDTSFMYGKGDTIYFASPNTHKSSTDATLFDRNTYFSIKADGSNLKEIYTTNDKVTSQAILTINNKDYLVVYEGTNVVCIDLSNNKKTTLAEDVTSAVFASSYVYENDAFVYYTVDRDEEETSGVTGNILKKVSIVENEPTQLRKEVGETIKLECLKDGKLYYTRNTQEQTTFYFANTLKSNGFEAGETKLTEAITDGITSFIPLGTDEDGNNLPIIYKYSSKLVISNFGQIIPTVLVDEDVTVQFISGDYIYFTTSSGIYRISYLDKVKQTIVEMSNFKEVNLSIDSSGKYLLFYAQTEDNTTGTYYAHVINLFDIEQGVDTTAKTIGKISTEDMPTEEEQE